MKKQNTNTDIRYFIRKSEDRGYFDHGWLKSYHSFSFGDYYDPDWMGFENLRVINDDWIAPNSGFPLHGHKHMEIVSVILNGEIEHKDILGHQEIVPVGHVQVMNAGSGIRHSEFNPSPKAPLRLLQIWIEPDSQQIAPHYKRIDFTSTLQKPGIHFLDHLNVHQKIRLGLIQKSLNVESFFVKAGQSLWLQATEEDLQISLQTLTNADATTAASPSPSPSSLLTLHNGDALALWAAPYDIQVNVSTPAKNNFIPTATTVTNQNENVATSGILRTQGLIILQGNGLN